MEGKTQMFFLSHYLKKGKFPSAVIQGKKQENWRREIYSKETFNSMIFLAFLRNFIQNL
jgi:predicted AAA+ superfamily ATPase